MKPYQRLIQKAAGNPFEFGLRLAARLAPAALFRRYDRLARRQGLDRLYLILSFDCDTPEDIPAAETLHARLRELGVKETYAAPGQILEMGAKTFRNIAADGAQFINHGALPHAEKRGERYWSVTFYNEMTPEEIRADILRGHEIVERVVGCAPKGFRAPHFGMLQQPRTLQVIHDSCRELGYRFSTSTLPLCAFEHGVIWRVHGLTEIPVSGSVAKPLQILDSWSYIVSPAQPELRSSYAALFQRTVDDLLSRRVAGVLNYYVDPAHAAENEVFFQAVAHAARRGLPSLHYEDLLEMVG